MARKPIHPGVTLKQDFMEPLGLSANALAGALMIPPNRISDIVRGRRNITADTALRLDKHFGVSADFWMNLQARYEIDLAAIASAKDLMRIERRRVSPNSPSPPGGGESP